MEDLVNILAIIVLAPMAIYTVIFTLAFIYGIICVIAGE